MAKTRAELVIRAMKILGVLGAGQTPYVEDSQPIDDLIDPMIASLSVRKVIHLTNRQSFEDAIFLPLSRCLAAAAAPDTGLPALANEPMMAEAELRAMQAPDETPEPIEFVDY